MSQAAGRIVRYCSVWCRSVVFRSDVAPWLTFARMRRWWRFGLGEFGLIELLGIRRTAALRRNCWRRLLFLGISRFSGSLYLAAAGGRVRLAAGRCIVRGRGDGLECTLFERFHVFVLAGIEGGRCRIQAGCSMNRRLTITVSEAVYEACTE